MKTIALDIGSSFIKAAVFDLDKLCIIEEIKTPSPQRLSGADPNLFEVPAMLYVETARRLLDEWSKKYSDVKLFVLSTQMHGFVYSYTGNEEEDMYISWQDMRCLHIREDGKSYLSYLQELFSRKEMKNCGVYIKPSLGMCNLFTLLEENSSIPRNGTLYTLGSYIISKLTGNNVCHITNAAPLGLVNVKEHCWDKEIIRKAGLQDIVLPLLVDEEFKACGTYETNGRKIYVFPDYGDQQVSILGSNPQEYEGHINIATAAQVSCISDEFIAGEFETRPYFENRYLCTISNMPSGRDLNVLINFLCDTFKTITGNELPPSKVWKAVQKEYTSNPGNLLVDMSFYPTPDNLNGGAITGITQSNLSLKNLFSAAYIDMASTYKKNLNILGKKTPIKTLVCVGGVARKTPGLLAAIRRVTGLPCRLSNTSDETYSGLFRIALCCAGICSNLTDTSKIKLT